jgi:hypothetical protein
MGYHPVDIVSEPCQKCNKKLCVGCTLHICGNGIWCMTCFTENRLEKVLAELKNGRDIKEISQALEKISNILGGELETRDEWVTENVKEVPFETDSE